MYSSEVKLEKRVVCNEKFILYYINEQIILTFNWDDSLLKKLHKCCIVRIIFELIFRFENECTVVHWGGM